MSDKQSVVRNSDTASQPDDVISAERVARLMESVAQPNTKTTAMVEDDGDLFVSGDTLDMELVFKPTADGRFRVVGKLPILKVVNQVVKAEIKRLNESLLTDVGEIVSQSVFNHDFQRRLENSIACILRRLAQRENQNPKTTRISRVVESLNDENLAIVQRRAQLRSQVLESDASRT